MYVHIKKIIDSVDKMSASSSISSSSNGYLGKLDFFPVKLQHS